ncbi:hypothetical protein HUT06_05040 [Actinomadura sp. NAK00032]|uniref:DUF6223 family protein n=1 Tax=Actinomadura sp. NAK00032 TaxID=2742128 RepID=UPI0015909D15|nr:DUF6223 family protein [Actinomadura sp. NAK00032]QKW33473.1 hypothetical protein HUT06_05040 [Actinomadura sp. NAK00032]
MRTSGTPTAARRSLAVSGSVLVGMVVLAAPAAAGEVQPVAADAYELSAGRVGAMVAALLGLAGAVVGGLALVRPRMRRGAGAALAAGLVGIALGGVVVATADGGLGTGNGLGGGYVALIVGAVAACLGGVGVARSRRAAAART